MATHKQRAANYLLDFSFIFILMILLLTGLAFIAMLFELTAFLNWLFHMNNLQQYLLLSATTIVYYGMSETLTSSTLGKFITGTIVVMPDGSKPDSETILKRTLMRIVPLEWITFLGMPSRGWHDVYPNVYVVDRRTFQTSYRKFKQHKNSIDL